VADALAAVPVQTRLVLTPGTASAETQLDAGLGLFIGPEGGLHPDEVDAALALGWTPAGLGPWVLRSDTAVVAALSRYGIREPRS
jgi:RsmE family RNA methyltransferase